MPAPLRAQGTEAHGEVVGLAGEPLAPRTHGARRRAGVQQGGLGREVDSAAFEHGCPHGEGAVTPTSNHETGQERVAEAATTAPCPVHEDPVDDARLPHLAGYTPSNAIGLWHPGQSIRGAGALRPVRAYASTPIGHAHEIATADG